MLGTAAGVRSASSHTRCTRTAKNTVSFPATRNARTR